VPSLPPDDDASALDRLLSAQAGVLTWRQAAAHLGAGRVRHLVSALRWRRICRGVLVTHTGDLTHDQQLWVAVLAAGHGAVLAGLTAAAQAGLTGFPRDPVYVLIPAARVAPALLRRLPPGMPGVVVKRSTALPEDHVQIGRPTRTTAARAVVDAAQWANGEDTACSYVAAACQQRLVAPDELIAALGRLPRARRRQLILRTAYDVAGGARRPTQDLGELP
jgi:hypothetical protein